MKKIVASLLALGLLALPAHADGGVKLGMLVCDVSGSVGLILGGSEAASCTFQGPNGTENYRGRITQVGLDIGVTTGAVMSWAVFAPGQQRRRVGLVLLENLDEGLAGATGLGEEGGRVREVVGSEHDVNPGSPPRDLPAILLREAAAHGDLHARTSGLHGGQVTEIAVEAVVGVLAHSAGVEHHEIRLVSLGDRHIARRLEDTGDAL